MPSKYLFRLRKAQTRRTRSTAVGTSTCGRDHIGLGQIEPRLDRLGLDIVSRNDFLRHSADYPHRAFDSYRESCSDMSCLGAQIRRRERRAAAIVPTVSSGRQMQQFWDARAREDAYYFVDDRLDYRHPDIERFWAEGEVDLDRVLESVGARIEPSDAAVEIGCGLGRLTRAIAARARSVTGIDVSEEMLTRARQLN